ncbi:V-type ATP synthase subunit I [Olsenella profusa]|uniref:V-type ATPase 116kDa subunit family protein n=1 Tax=Olsenella profusa F0195 TaxID=1125712 RepID=U2UVR7_9ACTN|nr:V-type ATP synthase subunit I [Olsenella profusa]ERL07207.1 V-type ATPase 116kDa subunit family protein [Olsenella profusa F0195]
MAVVKMQKLGICAMTNRRGDILGILQSMGVMQVEQGFDAQDMAFPDTHDTAVQFNRYAAQLDGAVKVLSLYAPEGHRGLSLFEGKQRVTRKEFDRSKAEADELLDAGRDIVDLEHDIREAQNTIGRDEVAQAALRPWMGLDVPFDYTGTRDMAFVAGTFQGDATAEELVQELTDGLGDNPPVEVRVLTREAGLTYACVLYLRSVSEKVKENLRRLGFARPSSSLDGTPAKLMAGYETDIERQHDRIDEAERTIGSYAPLRSRLETCADYFRDRAARYELLASVPETKSVFFLEGWVTAQQAPAVKGLLEERYGACVEFEEAREGEQEPTLLHNNRFSAAVEPVLESYGLPRHGKVDPSFIMSIFYVIFFGMMLSDAGYGIVVALGCGIVLARHHDMSEGTNRMLRLFFWCGLSTTFWGLMYGGIFGNAIDTIATTFFGYEGPQIVRPLWFEPMANPMALLMWCLLFGVIHLFVGLGIKGYELLKDGDGLGFVGEVLSWYLLLVGLIFMLLPTDLFASIAGFSVALPGWVATLSNACAAVGAILVVLLGSRDSANWGVRIASGLYDLYGVTGWLSDLLSYSRLLALGLATGVIANVVNMMAAMMGPTPLGIVAFVLIFVLGHTLNIGINMLGAYVHTNRLQFVEFFGKFYDGGGEAFAPFGTSHRYVEIREES